MGKTPVTLKIDGEMLRKVLKDHDLNFSDRAQKYGVSRQAVNGWFSSGRIRPRALIELALDLKLSPEQIDQIVISTRDEPEFKHENKKRKWKIIITEF